MGDDNHLSSIEKRKLYLQNFERDKEIAETRAKKFIKENREREQRMKNDINQIVEKRQKEMEEKDKKEKKEKEEIIKRFREKEKAIELKQSKQNMEIMEKYKQFKDKILNKKGKEYKYSIIYDKYIKQEEQAFKEAARKRHNLYNSANSEDIKLFSKKVDEKKEKDEENREKQKVVLTENWKRNKDNYFN